MRTHFCGEVDRALVGETVTICGWIHRRRDHGGVIFLDVRDREGIVQLVFDPDTVESFAIAEGLRSEFVIKATGRVRERMEGKVNPNMKTGEVEILGKELTILNASETPPFQLDEHGTAGEDVRLRHRYLDLRRPELQARIMLRSQITHFIRNYLHDLSFVDIETPMLTRSTPEGARDFLVPSRVHAGQFFALPQSPQLFKQLLMMSGFERYYQIVKCFRDEDLRANRQPEFTQIDIERSFVDESDIMEMAEAMIRALFRTVIDVELPDLPHLTYDEAVEAYGCDDPDLRNPLRLVSVDDLVASSTFQAFADPAADDSGRVAALRLPDGANLLSRKKIDELTRYVGTLGAKGLAYIKVNDLSAGVDGLQSPILKFLDAPVVMEILSRCDAGDNDLVFFGAGPAAAVNAYMGALRDRLGSDLNLYTREWAPCWITRAPMFERGENNALQAVHHPFTAPDCSPGELREGDPTRVKSRAYDMVLNGHEIGGGSIRIDSVEMQRTVFDVMQMGQEADVKFGFLLEALRYGCPPHGGIAFGLDRVAMLMCRTDAIRDVIAFPKTQSASCILTAAPGPVDSHQLRELHIQVLQES